MTVQAAYYPVVALDSLKGVHNQSQLVKPVYKLAFMKSFFKYNPLHQNWSDIDYGEIETTADSVNLINKLKIYPVGGYTIEVDATMIDGHFRLYPRNQSSISTLVSYGLQQGWNFKTVILYESNSGSLVFAFDAMSAINGVYGGTFLKPKFVKSKEIWNDGPPLVLSDEPPDVSGDPEFMSELSLPPYIYDGEVRGIIAGDNNSYYLAGTFRSIVEGRYAGRGAFDLVDGELGLKRPIRFRVNGGSVHQIISDETGGVFALGGFSSPRRRIARYNDNLELDDWAVNVNISGAILSGVTSEKYLYVGGSFSFIRNNSEFRNLVRFSIDDGVLDELWRPNPNSTIRALSLLVEEGEGDLNVSENKVLYIGGDFTSISSKDSLSNNYISYNRRYFVRYNIGDEGAQNTPEIDLEWGPVPNAPVHTIVLNNSHVYAGGAFTRVQNTTLTRVFRAFHSTNFYRGLDVGWSLKTTWHNRIVDNDCFVSSICLYNQYIFISTRNDIIGLRNSAIKSYLVEGGVEQSFNPIFENGLSLSQIWDMKIHDNHLYCAGTFQKINGQTRIGAASFDLSTPIPTLTPWSPIFNRPGPGTSGELGVSFRQTELGLPGPVSIFPFFGGVFVGGRDLSPSYVRRGLCKINSDGKIDPWNPSIDNSPSFNCIERHGGYIFAGFNSDRGQSPGQSTQRLIKISESTGQVSLTWPGGLIGPSGTGNVLALKVSENKLYVGSTKLIGGQSYIARYTLDENQITKDEWDPQILEPLDLGFVSGIDINNDQVYLTGRFSEVGGFLRDNYCVVSAQNSQTFDTMGDLSPRLNTDGSVDKFPVLAEEDGAIVAGSYTSVLRGSTSVLSTDPYSIYMNLNINGAVNSIISDNNGGFFLGGRFTKILGKRRDRIAHIVWNSTLERFELSEWAPKFNGEIRKIYIYGNLLYVVGTFTSIGGTRRLRAARFNLGEEGQITLDQNFITDFQGSPVHTVVSDGDCVYFGLNDSYFESGLDGRRRSINYSSDGISFIPLSRNNQGIIRVHSTTGVLDTSWKCGILFTSRYSKLVGSVLDLALDISNNRIYICGFYNRVNHPDPIAGNSTRTWMQKYVNATCFSISPDEDGFAQIHDWSVPIPRHPYRNIDSTRANQKSPLMKGDSSTEQFLFKTLTSIKIYGDHVYVSGAPFRWGPTGNIHRSSRIARFPKEQTSENLGIPDTTFRVSVQSNPGSIVSLSNGSFLEHRENLGTDIEIDESGNIHFCSLNSNIGIFTNGQFAYTPFDGYLKLNLNGQIINSFNNISSQPAHVSRVFDEDLIIVGTRSSRAWDLSTSIARIRDEGKIERVVENSRGTIDIKFSMIKFKNFLYVLSQNRFDDLPGQFFRAINLNNRATVPINKLLVSSTNSNAKTLARVGNYIIIAGGEMTRDPAAGDLNQWGEFIDHGVSGGRKVIYYRIPSEMI